MTDDTLITLLPAKLRCGGGSGMPKEQLSCSPQLGQAQLLPPRQPGKGLALSTRARCKQD